jgi:Domain of unknown function (DUF4136)
MRQLSACCLLVILGTVVTMAGVKVKAERDPKFDFTTIKTWAWNTASPGEVKIWVSAKSNAEPVKRHYEPVIMKAVEDQLTKRGISKAASGTPDIHVTYYVLVSLGTSAQTAGQFLPSNAQWGLPLFTPNTTALSVYPQGALVLDVDAPAAKGLIWRGLAESKVDTEKSDADRVVRLGEIIKSLFDKFPKK